jgi:hypothetical protein
VGGRAGLAAGRAPSFARPQTAHYGFDVHRNTVEFRLAPDDISAIRFGVSPDPVDATMER